MHNPLRIIGLRAEHVKRLEVVEITPDPNMVIVGGSNGAGKSSLLDSIAWALAGKSAQKGTVRPIRDGYDTAEIVVDLGELVVTRSFRGDTQTLVVRAADGSRLSSAQSVLDALIGEMAFDPLAFAGQAPKVQRDVLLALVGVDLEEIDERRRCVFEERTHRNRYLSTILARIEAVPSIQRTSTLTIAEAMAAHAAGEAVVQRNREIRSTWHRAKTRLSDATVAVARAREALNIALLDEENAHGEVQRLDAAFQSIPFDPDMEALNAQVAHAEAGAQHQRELQRRADMEAEAEGIAADVIDMTAQIESIDADKAEALAGAVMPVEGLGVDEHGLTYFDVPFTQCSAAEKLRVSVAIAMASNPRIRVVRIAEGALLDDDSMAMLAELAERHDFQCFVEVVHTDDPAAIVIEDGKVRT